LTYEGSIRHARDTDGVWGISTEHCEDSVVISGWSSVSLAVSEQRTVVANSLGSVKLLICHRRHPERDWGFLISPPLSTKVRMFSQKVWYFHCFNRVHARRTCINLSMLDQFFDQFKFLSPIEYYRYSEKALSVPVLLLEHSLCPGSRSQISANEGLATRNDTSREGSS